MRKYFYELGQHLGPVLEYPLAPRAARIIHVLLNQTAQRSDVLFLEHGFQIDARKIAAVPENAPSSSKTYAIPPLMPAAKFLPVEPRITIVPLVMYSQPWSPTPSTTAVAPELRTQTARPQLR